MLSKLIIELENKDEIDIQSSSLFQGALMELIPKEFAAKMHESNLHPYTQYIQKKDNKLFWVINCINKEASDNIIKHSLMNIDFVNIKKKNLILKVKDKIYKETSYENLKNKFYEETSERYINIRFLTPTAFKQQGRYCFYPDLRCIYQSLMNKYDSASSENSMIDEDTLNYLSDYSHITRYNLRSVSFHLEGIKIPSFIGTITIKLNGTQTMANFANMLFEFGSYSGVGIKTGIGMGAIEKIR